MSNITPLGVEHQSFHVADCTSCGQRSLAWLDVSSSGDEVWRCLECQASLNQDSPSSPPSQQVGARFVRELGYIFLDEEASASSRPRGACGADGVRACPSGGCSSGSCGSGGGCGGCG